MAATIVSIIMELRTWEEPNPQISTVVAAVGSGLSREATPLDFSNLLRRIEPIVFTQCVCKICSFIVFVVLCLQLLYEPSILAGKCHREGNVLECRGRKIKLTLHNNRLQKLRIPGKTDII